MELDKLAGDCDDLQTCPAVWAEGDAVRVQGPEDAEGLPLGAGETGVRIPAHLILEAADRIRERRGDR